MLDKTLTETLIQYELFLRQLPLHIDTITSSLNLRSNQEYYQRLDSTVFFIVGRAKLTVDHWPIELNQLIVKHNNLRNLVTDILLFSAQLSSATALMSRAQRGSPFSELDLKLFPFDLSNRLIVLRAVTPATMVQNIRDQLQQAWKALFDREFSAATISNSVVAVIPRFIDFVSGAIDIYTKQHSIKPGDVNKHAALSLVVRAAATNQAFYIETLTAANNLQAYFSNNSMLLNEPDKIIANVFSRGTISELNEALRKMTPSLQELELQLKEL